MQTQPTFSETMALKGSDDKESTYNAGDLSSVPELGRSPGEGYGYPLNILAWKIPWAVVSGMLQSMGHKKSDTTEQLTFSHKAE